MIPRLQTTRKEVISVLAVLSLLGLLLFNALQNAKRKTARLSCISNIKVVGTSFRIWANEHGNLYPMETTADAGGARESILAGQVWKVFQVMSNELFWATTIRCPEDEPRSTGNWTSLGNSNVSYFVGIDANDVRPNLLLAGDRNISMGDRLLTGISSLGTDPTVNWTRDLQHRGNGNVGLADGSVAMLSTDSLHQFLVRSGDSTNRLAFPQ